MRKEGNPEHSGAIFFPKISALREVYQRGGSEALLTKLIKIRRAKSRRPITTSQEVVSFLPLLSQLSQEVFQILEPSKKPDNSWGQALEKALSLLFNTARAWGIDEQGEPGLGAALEGQPGLVMTTELGGMTFDKALGVIISASRGNPKALKQWDDAWRMASLMRDFERSPLLPLLTFYALGATEIDFVNGGREMLKVNFFLPVDGKHTPGYVAFDPPGGSTFLSYS